MGWLDRILRGPPGAGAAGEVTPPTGRPAPGLAALFEGLESDGSHAVLDLGPASESHLRVYGPFARQVRFADLLTAPPHGDALSAALRALPPNPDRPYDVVLAWNVLDRLRPEEGEALVARLMEVTAPGARLYAAVSQAGEAAAPPLRFTMLGVDRVEQEAAGPPEPAHDPLLPAQVERVLAPFEVIHAYTLRSRMREYVAVRRDRPQPSSGRRGAGRLY